MEKKIDIESDFLKKRVIKTTLKLVTKDWSGFNSKESDPLV